LLRKNRLLALFAGFCFSALAGALIYSSSLPDQKEKNTDPAHNLTGPRVQDELPAEKPARGNPGNTGGGTDTAAAAPEGEANAPGNPGTAGDEKTTGASQQFSPGEREALRRQIGQKYLPRLQSTASGYEARLNGLVAAAVEEYRAAQAADPAADITPIFNKYYAAGKSLEAECDARFYSLLAAFENELKTNSLPTDLAVKAKSTYEAAKSARAGQLLSGKP